MRALYTGLIAALVLLPAPGQAASTIAAPTIAPTLSELEALCPGVGANPLRFGQLDRGQQYRPEGPALAEFGPPEQTYTSWSGLLAALTIRAASPDGAINQRWFEGVEAALRAGGWSKFADPKLATPLDEGILFEKATGSNADARQLVFEVAIPGALMLRCGDQNLLRIDRAEADGELAPGSPRPAPLAPAEPAPLPNPADCDRAALLEAIGHKDRIDEASPAFVQFDARSVQTANEARDAERDYRWVVWKLLQSGRVDNERLWQIEEQAAPLDVDALEEDMGEFLQFAGEASRARDRGDAKAVCLAFVPLVVSRARSDQRKAARHRILISALETEARKLGVSLD